MWARIENNIVMEIIDFDPTDRFHSSIVWIPCTIDTAEHDTYNGDGTFTPYSPPVIIPDRVTRAQAHVALLNAGILDAVVTLMANPLTDPILIIAWQNAQFFERTSPSLITVAAQLGLTDADLDALFIAADTIRV